MTLNQSSTEIVILKSSIGSRAQGSVLCKKDNTFLDILDTELEGLADEGGANIIAGIIATDLNLWLLLSNKQTLLLMEPNSDGILVAIKALKLSDLTQYSPTSNVL